MSTTLFALSVLICASPSSALAAEGEVTDAKNGAGLPKNRRALQGFPDCCTSEGTCDTTTGDDVCNAFCKPEYCSPPAVEDLPYESMYDDPRGSDLPHCECDGYDNGAFRWMSRMCMTTYEEGRDSVCYPTRVGHPGTVLNGRFYSNNCDGDKRMCSPWTRPTPTVTTPEPQCVLDPVCDVEWANFPWSQRFLSIPPCCSCSTDADCSGATFYRCIYADDSDRGYTWTQPDVNAVGKCFFEDR